MAAGGRHEDAARAMDALRRIVRAVRTSNRSVERAIGVSASQLFVLRQLSALPRQSLSDLVESTLTHQSTVSEVVGRLVDAGLIVRHVASDDARRAELEVTPRGRRLLRGAPESVQSVLLEGLRRMSVSRRRALVDGLEGWVAAARLGDVPPTMFFEPTKLRRKPASGVHRRGGHRDPA